jgi:hypothetical protein
LPTCSGPSATHESTAARLDLADEAIRWAQTIDDDWAIAMAIYEKVKAAQTARDLREHVDRAASLLQKVGDIYHLADLLASAAYGASCLGSDHERRRAGPGRRSTRVSRSHREHAA